MITQAAITQLQSLQHILQQITDNDYTLALPTLKGASVGKHTRHIIEFYQCLLFNVTDNTVNYDKRNRNLLLEENVKYTLDYITEIIDNIERIDTNKRILLAAIFDDKEHVMESSLYREITYNVEHTVHHLAIIGIAIPLHFGYINTSADFGYAQSTINYLKTQQAS